MRSAVGILLVLLTATLAGCLSAEAPDVADTTAPFRSGPELVMGALETIPAPGFDAGAAVGNWETFVTENPYRHHLTPHNVAASEYLLAQLEDAGFDAEIKMLDGTAYFGVPSEFRIVQGVLEGADPTKRIALVAHYDTVPQTLQGAYDDGAGTIAELEICKLLAQQRERLQHSIDCLFFDGEETGLSASAAWMAWYAATPDRGFEYVMAFGYDMTGINWPGHEWKLYAMSGTDTDELAELQQPHLDFLEVALHDFLDGRDILPGATEGIEILNVHDRNSDEQQFKRQGIPVVRFAGGRNAADYPGYHQPWDTIEFVYLWAGGRENFVQGFDAVIRTSYYTILGYDAFDPYDLPTS